jgi:hypothetical protein
VSRLRFEPDPPFPAHSFPQLLQHANDDTLRLLHRKLVGASRGRSKSLLRTQSGPDRFLWDQLASSRRSSEDVGTSGSLRRTKSGMPEGGAAPSGLQRTKSVTRLPASNGSSLRRTSSTGVAAASPIGQPGGNSLQGGGSLPRQSASQPDSAAPEREGGEAGRQLVTPQKKDSLVETLAADANTDDLAAEGFVTPLQAEPRLHRLSFGGSAAHQPCHPPVCLSVGSQQSSTDGSDSHLGAAPDSPPASVAAGRRQLLRQGTFSQPYFAELGPEELQAAASRTEGTPAAGSVSSKLAAAAEREESTGSVPIASLAGSNGSEEAMSVEDIHKVRQQGGRRRKGRGKGGEREERRVCIGIYKQQALAAGEAEQSNLSKAAKCSRS